MFSKFFKKTHDVAHFEEKRYFEVDEEKFFGRLRRALPNFYIFPRVDIGDLLNPIASTDHQKTAALKLLSGRKADYAIFDPSMTIICVIELTSQTDASGAHVSNVDFFKSAGIKTVRWDRNALPNLEQILRILAPLASFSSPKPDVAASTVLRTLPTESTRGLDTVQAIYEADPVSSNIVGVPVSMIENLTPDKHIKTKYPHIWQRICLFSNEPKHLKKYLSSLSIQDRGEERAGFPLEVIKEISDIQAMNDQFLMRSEPRPAWQPNFINI